jgi:hypothetical protein
MIAAGQEQISEDRVREIIGEALGIALPTVVKLIELHFEHRPFSRHWSGKS